VTYGQISAQLDKYEVEVNGTITGCGQLAPGIAYAPITVILAKSDGPKAYMKVTSQSNGAFSFSYTPNTVGDWKISISCSGSSYILNNADISLKVIEVQQETTNPDQTPNDNDQPTKEQDLVIPAEYVTGAFLIIIVAAIAVFTFLFVKKRNKSSQVLISSG
jgi:hypothetical protein